MRKLLLLFICCIYVFIGCTTKSVRITDSNILLEKGLHFYEKRKYKQAAIYLEDAIKYADSPSIAAKAQLYLGNAYFNDENYLEAIPSYKQFLDFYPDAPEAPDVLYKLGLSYYKEVNTFDREQQTTLDALNIFNKLKTQYPSYANTKNIDKYIKELNEKLAQKELYVAEFYFRTNQEKAAEKRLKYIIENYENTEVYKMALIRYCKYLTNHPNRKQEAIAFLNKLLNNSTENEVYAEDISELLNKIKNM